MKKILIILVATLAVSLSAGAKTVKESFTAGGKCEMCKARIQKAVKAVPGVLSAAWNIDTKTCSVVYDDSKTSLDAIEKAVAAVGHDTPAYKATDEAYSALPGCCRYRE